MGESKSVTETLRRPFKAEEVGKLPRVTCPKCSDRNQRCDEHRKMKCGECQAYISERHIHIDYVGHADVTSRLLEADEEWAWEPKAKDIDPAVLAAAVATGNPEVVRMVQESAPPKFDLDDCGNPVGFWILLTVGGVTRPGYGSVPSGQPDAVKVLIGDALRNAAMRFGVALALWAKGDRADPAAENATASAGQARRGRQPAGESFENAAPAPARQRTEGNGHAASGEAVRPAQAPRPAAVQPGGEADPEAQPYADEAHEARVTETVKDIHNRARDAHKLAALIRNPATGGVGGLGQYLNHRRGVLQKAEQALAALLAAGATAGIDAAGIEGRLKDSCGHDLEEASAEEMAQATELILKEAVAA
jgi:hypothetical protein